MNNNLKYNAVHHGVLIKITEDNLIHLKYPADLDLGLKQAKSIDLLILDQVGLENFTLMVDFTDSFGVLTKEAQKFFANDAPSIPQITASAIIVNNLPVRILVNFYLKFFKPKYLTKIFSSVEPAKYWLSNIKFKNESQTSNVG